MLTPYKILESIGLTDKEIKLYLSLLKYGDLPASILSKKSSINRSTVYTVTDDLKSKGLISTYKKHDIQFFHADSTHDLLTFLHNEKKRNNEKIKILKANLDKLELLQSFTTSKPNVEFFEGFEGVKKVYEKSLKANDYIYAFFGQDFYTDELKEYISNIYLPKRLNKEITVRALMHSNLFENKDTSQLRERKYFESLKNLQVEINIFNSMVAFISYSEERYIGVTIEDNKISSALKTIHELIWNTT